MNRASEEEVQATLRWQAEILDLVPAIVCDLENKITFWNRTIEQFYGYGREEALGRLAQELLQTQFPQPLPEIITELRRTGSWEGELIQTRRNGTQVVIAAYWVLHKDQQGQPDSILKLNTDLTKLKKVEAALRTAHAHNLHILNNMAEEFLIFDRDWRCLYVNQAGLAQARQPGEALLDQRIWEVFPEVIGTEVQRQWERVMGERAPANFEYYYAPYEAWFEHRVYPSLEGIAVFITDISERKQAEKALRDSEARLRDLNHTLEQRVAERTTELEHSLEELNQFTYVASHDLKAPLRAIKNLANWVIEDTGESLPETSKVHLTKLQGRIQRMEEFLDDLLTYSRLGRHYYQELENIDTRVLIEEVIDLLAPPPSFTLMVQEKMPTLRTYRILLALVFKNLIENALKHHHRPAGRIEISAQERDGFIQFSVTDDGPGIDPTFHERIFQMFQILRPRNEVDDTGAGLAIVKKAVESQGGAITVISAEGQGATFRFTWPK